MDVRSCVIRQYDRALCKCTEGSQNAKRGFDIMIEKNAAYLLKKSEK